MGPEVGGGPDSPARWRSSRTASLGLAALGRVGNGTAVGVSRNGVAVGEGVRLALGSNSVGVASLTLTVLAVSVFWLPGDSSGAADKLQAGIPRIRTSEITARRTTFYPTRRWRVRKRFSVPEMMRRTLERWAKMISVARPTLAQNGYGASGTLSRTHRGKSAVVTIELADT